ncbi:MAG TPA: Xaa-Pro dipeptidase, partial [Gammaproteobacteria bacterium]|nr:Xaa-Pro dipeptidase [Gammaproteobacteria bacterium]
MANKATRSRETLDRLYPAHQAELVARYESVLANSPYEAVAVYSGAPRYRFRDDQTWPFRVGAFYQQWVPCDDHAACVLLFRAGRTPLLVLHLPRDYWHSVPAQPSGAWTAHFDIEIVDDVAAVRGALPEDLSGCALVGEPDAAVSDWGCAAVNPAGIVTQLEFARLYKTAYEVECVAAANRCSARGHRAACEAFLGGAGEFEIHLAYLEATAHSEAELPYANIIALNEHGATLHYGRFDRVAPANPRSFLIDAGARCNGYAADVTRTWPAAPGGEFAALVQALDRAQQALVEGLRIGQSYVDVHEDAQLAVAVILEDFGIVGIAPEDMVTSGVSNVFLPHGVGHHLGLQVHDTGGKLAGPDGSVLPQPEAWPFLRNLRPVEQGNVFTIEPGIYFIDSLLQHLRGTPLGRHVNWDAVERLSPCGGVRIEDNIWMGPGGARNLSREAFDSL